MKRERKRVDIERGGRLQTARLAADYETAAEAADALDMASSTYNNHEEGWRGITHDMARRYADFFDIELDWLYDGIGDMKGLDKPKTAPDPLAGLPPAGREEALTYIDFLRVKYGV